MSSPPTPRRIWLVATDATAARWAQSLDPARGTPHALVWGKARPLVCAEELDATCARIRPELLLLTSPEALAFLGSRTAKGLEAVCVGAVTAEVATTYGVTVRGHGDGGGIELARWILDLPSHPRRFLWLRGRDARTEVAALLRASGATVEELITYAVEPEAGFPEAVRNAPEPAAVLVGSPRGAEALVAALAAAGRALPPATELLTAGPSTDRRLRELGFPLGPSGLVKGSFVVHGEARYHPRSG